MHTARVTVRWAVPTDRPAPKALLVGAWGSTSVVAHDERIGAGGLPALVAVTSAGRLAGAITLLFAGGECEVVTLTAVDVGTGVGTALLQAAVDEARGRDCRRVWLVTSNDNLNAIRFYQRRGMRSTTVHRGAIDRTRELKPSLPLIGDHGIALHDELEFELQLGSDLSC